MPTQDVGVAAAEKVPGRSPGDAFIQRLVELAAHDPRLTLLTADLALEDRLGPFAEAHPERFHNLGAAVRNAIGVAAGMAAAGKVPVVVVRGDAVAGAADLVASLAHSRLPVLVVAMPSGFECRAAGSPLAFADLAAMLAIPGLRVVAPADADHSAMALPALLAAPGPTYFRLKRDPHPVLFTSEAPLELGVAAQVRDGRDLTLVAAGGLAAEALEACSLLEAEGLKPRLLVMETLKPLDTAAVRLAARETGGLVIAEDHLLSGGLGAAIAQDLARFHPVPIEFVAVSDEVDPAHGSEAASLQAAYHVDPQAMAAAARKLRGRMR